MIYFVIPLFNEAQNIPNLKRELTEALTSEEVFYVFSDDGSSDDSIHVINTEFANTSFVVIGDGINRGPGSAFNKGFDWVLERSQNNNDLVVTIEADCTSDSSILKDMVVISRMGFDLVLASVYAQSGSFEKTNFVRRFISATANLMMRFAFNIRVLTLSSFYRVYSIEILRKIKERHEVIISENGFICMLEILQKAIRLNARVIEIPTVLRSTKRIGKSKMKILSTTVQYLSFLFRSLFQAK